jgi:hypothetical protein
MSFLQVKFSFEVPLSPDELKERLLAISKSRLNYNFVNLIRFILSSKKANVQLNHTSAVFWYKSELTGINPIVTINFQQLENKTKVLLISSSGVLSKFMAGVASSAIWLGFISICFSKPDFSFIISRLGIGLIAFSLFAIPALLIDRYLKRKSIQFIIRLFTEDVFHLPEYLIFEK